MLDEDLAAGVPPTGLAPSAKSNRPVGADLKPGTYRKRPRDNEAVLEIQKDAFPDSAIQGLIDGWILPALVDRIVETMLDSAADVGP